MKMLLMICLLLSVAQISHADTESKIDKEKVRRAVRSGMKDYKNCFDAEYKKESKTIGKLVLQWDITDTGAIENMKVVETAFNNSKFENCVMSAVKKVQFPHADSKVAQIKYPFIFQTNSIEVQF